MTKTAYGIGLGTPETMEMALREVGTPRILLASAVAAVTKVFGRRGDFYRIVGDKARSIDGPTDGTDPPYDKRVVLGPIDPHGVAREAQQSLGRDVVVMIADINDIGGNIGLIQRRNTSSWSPGSSVITHWDRAHRAHRWILFGKIEVGERTQWICQSSPRWNLRYAATSRAFPTVFATARGSVITDESGREHIDFFCGAGAVNYGHNHPAIKRNLPEYLASDGIQHALDMATSAKRAFLETFREVNPRTPNLDYKEQFTGPTGPMLLKRRSSLPVWPPDARV